MPTNIIFPEATYTTGTIVPTSLAIGNERLLAHSSKSNRFDPLIGYGLNYNLKIKKEITEDNLERLVYSRQQMSYLGSPETPEFQVVEKQNSLECLIRFNSVIITYSQNNYPLDTPEDRVAISNTGLYKNIDYYSKWSEEDSWLINEEANYKHLTIPYSGQPLLWEKNALISERQRRSSTIGSALSGASLTQALEQEDRDVRPYRPILKKKITDLPDSLVMLIGTKQVTVEDLIFSAIDNLILPQYPSQSEQHRVYNSPDFPLTAEQRNLDPLKIFVDLKTNVAKHLVYNETSTYTKYINLKGYNNETSV